MQFADRTKARRALDLLSEQPIVVAASLVPADEDPTGCWTIEASIDCYGIPPRILRPLAEHDLVIREARPEPDHYRLIASVV